MRNWILFLSMGLLLYSCSPFKEITFTGVEHLDIISIGKNGVEAEIKAKIKNPNRMSFVVSQSVVDVSINGMPVGSARLSERVKIKRNSENIYTFRVLSDFSQLSIAELTKILAFTFSKNMTIGIKGNIKAGKGVIKRNIPIDFTEKVRL